jgi:hypothetical protein
MKPEDRNAPLSRSEHIKEETRLAAEFGQAPKKPLSVARNFRTEGLTRLAPPAAVARGDVLPVMSVAPPLAPRGENPYAELARSGPLLGEIEDLVKRIDDGNRALLTPRLLELYGDFVAQAQDAAQLQALQQRVLTAAFGQQYFTQSKGGSAQQQGGASEQATPGQ